MVSRTPIPKECLVMEVGQRRPKDFRQACQSPRSRPVVTSWHLFSQLRSTITFGGESLAGCPTTSPQYSAACKSAHDSFAIQELDQLQLCLSDIFWALESKIEL